jgi:hypothetical protein
VLTMNCSLILSPVALFTKILTIKNCRKCKTKIKKSFTKILTIILSVKIVLTLRVKLPCTKCKILIVREILVLSFIVWIQKIKVLKRPFIQNFCKRSRCLEENPVFLFLSTKKKRIMKKTEFSPSLQVVFLIVDRL